VNQSHIFSPDVLRDAFQSSHHLGRSVFCYESVESTNNLAAVYARNGAASGAVFTADFQTAGKGRHQKKWHAAAGENIMTSLMLRPTVPLEKLSLLPLITAVAVAETIDRLSGNRTGHQPEIKWPNDVLMNRKKICGILLESSVAAEKVDYIIIGIGLNVNQTVFPEDVAESATSLALMLGQPLDLQDVFIALIHQIDEHYTRFVSGDVYHALARWRHYAVMLGKPISFVQHGETRHGVAEDIDENGRLKIRLDTHDGTHVIETVTQADIQTIRYNAND
jgi:BirA family transcriptional regulator, biotin operon repressor / biotin---[acetyl-CoA-carboxylase] ligase